MVVYMENQFDCERLKKEKFLFTCIYIEEYICSQQNGDLLYLFYWRFHCLCEMVYKATVHNK